MAEKYTTEFVYTGALLYKDALMHSYVQLDPEQKDGLGEAVLYDKALSHHEPGAIIRFTAIGSKTAIIAESAVFKGWWEGDPKKVIAWQAMTKALIASESAYKAKKVDPWKDTLDPLREAYAALEARERAVLIAAVVAYIAGED